MKNARFKFFKKYFSSLTSHLSFCRGFTLIELSVVVSIMVTLLSFITISLVLSQQTASLISMQDLLVAELKQQSIKSMIGDTEGRATSDSYGIHFDSNRFVTFHGSAYSSGDTSNSFFNLESNIQFNNSNFDIIFSRLNGEIAAPLTVELQDNTNSQLKRLYLNKYGVITQVESL